MNAKKLVGLAVLGMAAAASAQISPTGPFTGSASEGFEGMSSPPFIPCLAVRVFNATADLCTVDPNTGAPTGGTLLTSGWSFECVIGPHGGGTFFGSANGANEYTFDTPVGKFGGYFGANHSQVANNGFDVLFYDASGAQIGSTQHGTFSPCGTWQWQGWETTTPAKKIRLTCPVFGGGFIMMDDMEIAAGGPPPCYPDCNLDGTLNLGDFGCFQTKFALGDPYADCNGDGNLNLGDFGCFQTKFALGCP